MRVMIVDDDRELANALAGFVRECDHEVVATVTSGGLAAIRSFAAHQPDVVILDVMMPKFNGFTVCQQLLSRDPRVKVVLISGSVGLEYPSFATCKAAAYLQKPVRMEELRNLLDTYSARAAAVA